LANPIRILFLGLFLLLGAAGIARAAGPSLLFEPATGAIISQDRAGEPWYPASLTKLMTAYLVFGELRQGRLTLDQKIVVSIAAQAQPPSKIGILAGKSVTVDVALQSLLVYSANDMAYVLAEAVRPDWRLFVKDMNATAARLGMTATHYVNPNGLFDPRQVTTARDIGLLASALLRDYPEYAHYFSQKTVTVGKRKLANRNILIRQMPEADGMKTGFVCNSGFNLVATATHEKRQLAAIVFGSNSGKARADLAQMLLTDGFARQPTGAARKISAIANVTLGTRLPVDMTKDVCKQKRGFMAADFGEVEGWGYSLGQYGSAKEADAALRALLLTAPGLDSGGTPGVIAMPGGGRYTALVWNLDQAASLSACSAYRQSEQTCEVMTPAFFGELASLAEKAAKDKKKSQGQGTGKAAAGKKKKKVTGQGN